MSEDGFSADLPRFDADVLSPEFPCGAAWLANCLLELNVPLWHLWSFDVRGEWLRCGPQCYRYVAENRPWRQTLPSLVPGREFAFRTRPAVRFTHDVAAVLDRTTPVVLFVRDPRDALYSEWRRQLRNAGPLAGRSFEAFLASRYHHYPISYRDYLLLTLRLCKLVLAHRPQRIVRFEDYKAAPQQTLSEVSRFLCLDATDAQIVAATQRSDYAVVKRVEEDLASRGELRRQFNRRGQAFEYREAYTPEMHRALGRGFDDICVWLGYAPSPSDVAVESGALGDVDIDVLLAALRQASPHGNAISVDLLRLAVR